MISLSWAPNAPDVFMSLTVSRLNAPPLVLRTAAKDPQNEQTLTLLLLEALNRKMDRFVASAMELPTELRHERQADFIEKAAGLVIWIDSPTSPSVHECSRHIGAVLPAFLFLCGTPQLATHMDRKHEWGEITAMAEVLKLRLGSQEAPTCHTCLKPVGNCSCQRS